LRRYELFLLWDRDRWTVDWSTQTIFRELEGDNLVHTIARAPVRANIYDVSGRGLAVAGDSVTVGIVPDEIEDEPAVLSRLSQVLHVPQKEIKASYESQPPSWFIPIADISVEASREHYESLSTEPGILLREKRTRVYREPVAAPHIVGFLGKIPAEEFAAWQQRGYTGDELVGRAGIEAWGEPHLAGRRGGVLTVITPEGQLVATLARREAVPARSIYLTLDSAFQRTVEELLGERKGAVVVMDVNDGRILALATWPRFDPNLFARGIDPDVWAALANDPANPLLNPALQGQYAPGSTSKIVTMGTILKRGGIKPTQTYNCPGSWNKLGWPMTCWLKSGHGTIDLITALAASCDVTFCQVGYDLSLIDVDALPGYARSFGLGTPTDIGERSVSPSAIDSSTGWESEGDRDPLDEAIGFPIPVAGKTGTAQNEGELAHAWFIGYLPADKPEIAIVAMLESIGEGATYAAPLFRQVAEAYCGLATETQPQAGDGDH
jgi:penicillin-binding protein 2